MDQPDIIRIPFVILFILLDCFLYPGMEKAQMVLLGSSYTHHDIVFLHARYLALHAYFMVSLVLFLCLPVGKELAETITGHFPFIGCAFLRTAKYCKDRSKVPCPNAQYHYSQDHLQ
jgi:hypothetical protein